jgi:predicted metalloprotease with PDZ domain
MTPELREHFKGPRDAGVLVTRIEPESSAATAGLRVGDIILSAAGEPIRAPFDLVQAVARVEENKALELKILRGGNQQDLSVKPKGRPTPWADPEHWGDWIEKRFHRSGDALRQRLEELERRLEQFERRLDRMSEAEET